MREVISSILAIKGLTLDDLKKSGYMRVSVNNSLSNESEQENREREDEKKGGIMDLHVDYLGNEIASR